MTLADDAATSELSNHQHTPAAPPRLMRPARSALRSTAARWRQLIVATLLIFTTGLAGSLWYFEYHNDQQSSNAAAHDAIRAATDGAVALLSSSPDSLSHDVNLAKSRLTSDFAAYYQHFTERILAPTTLGAQVTTSARVIRAAIAELHSTSAVVLVFVSQKTASKTSPAPVTTTSAVRITLAKADGRWLIDKFDTL